METFAIKDLTFRYPKKEIPALKNVNLSVDSGAFITICGRSGSGKSTLLRCMKSVLTPHGERSGQILFYGRQIEDVEQREQAQRIGYVLQNPDNQIVTDKVWHELAFGLESLGFDTKTIRLRVAEMASFFGIQTWFMKDVNQLSGGQKQLLNLASVMAMQPDILILDEPTAQLDPIAAGDFLETVKKINRELGTTVIISEHRLEDVIPMSDRTVVIDDGCVIADEKPADVGAILTQMNHEMFVAMPTPLQVYSLAYQKGFRTDLPCPIDVREGRKWLTALCKDRTLHVTGLPKEQEQPHGTETPVIKLKDIWFKYDKRDADVIKDLSLEVYKGELFCIVGGNGTGKTTALNLMGGILKPYRGNVLIKGKKMEKYKGAFSGLLGVLPQNPQAIFVEKTVALDLQEMLEGSSLNSQEQEEKIREIAELVELETMLDVHPYDLSGGEQQRAALAKVLLLEPQILLLDEPTKGLDMHFKEKLAGILKKLEKAGTTIVMVSHDVEFCGKYAHRCAMFFDGKIVTTNTSRNFFSGNSFYTTATNRMSRHIFDRAITIEDLKWLYHKNEGAVHDV